LSEEIAAWNAQAIPEADVFRRKWSWAAFLSPVLWPLTHGYALISLTEFAALIGVRLARLPVFVFILWLAILATRVVLGVIGNRLALDGRRFESTEDFEDCETAWRNFGIIMVAIGIALILARIGLRAASRYHG
jgi:hypothetical protein